MDVFYFREVVEKNMGIFHNFCHEVSLAMNYLCQLPNYMHEIVQIYTILTTRTMIFELGVDKVSLAFLTSELATEGSIKRALLFFFYARVCQCVPEYARVCQSMPEYSRVCQSLAKFCLYIAL